MTADLKQRMVAAHRSGDWELAAQLSQEREKERREARKHRRCVCGVVIYHTSTRCLRCSILKRFYGSSLKVNP